MRYNFFKSLSFTLSMEGGWSDDPQDPGGCTMKGITLETYSEWCSNTGLPPPTSKDLRDIPDALVEALYRSLYWSTIQGDELPDGIDLSVFDFAVNTGPSRSADLLQKAVGLTGPSNDSVIGPITLAAVERQSPFLVIASLADTQESYYRSLSDFSVFGRGWLARTQQRRSAAMALVSGRAVPTNT